MQTDKGKEEYIPEQMPENEFSDELRTGLDISEAEYASHPSVNAESGEDDDDLTVRKRRPRIIPGTHVRAGFAFAAGALACFAVIILLTYVFDIGKIIPGSRYEYYKKLDDAYGKYYKITEMIGEDPLAKTTPAKINDKTLKKIVADTGDPYAQYYTAEEYKKIRRLYEGEYVGIGVSVVQDGDDIIIMKVTEDSPADDAGILTGDIIVSVEGKSPSDINEAVELISGEAGTDVDITVKRGEEAIDMTVTRAVIDTETVTYDVSEDDPEIGYIGISAFQKETSDEFKMAVKDLKRKGCDRFIIDLRGNGGGLTEESVAIADYLLPECRIMTEVRKDGTEKVHNSKAGSADITYVMLTDGNTASASEILAGAVQDNKGGLIIGGVTYGKGVTQTTYKFKDGSAVKLTQTEYFRPNGEKVNGIGITPDIETKPEKAMETAIRELSE